MLSVLYGHLEVFQISVSLYDYQKEAVEKLKNGHILVGGVGSGKSRTGIAYYISKVCGIDLGSLTKNTKVDASIPLVIITTARKRDQKEWDGDLAPFFMSTNQKENYLGIDVIVDSWNNIHKYITMKNAFFLFDEQRVVGAGMWVKSFIKISRMNKWILMSATPGDTWLDYIPVFIANGFYRNRTEFIRHHVVYSPYSKFPKVDHYVDVPLLAKFRKQIIVTMKYAKKTRSHYNKIYAPFRKELIDQVMETKWDIYNHEPIQNSSRFCSILRKIVNSDPRRIDMVSQIVEKHPKVIIFYNFNYERELLITMGADMGIVVAQWNGIKHEPIPKVNSWIYLVQYSAGSEGWNCIETDTIIFYSQNYSYKSTIQAAGRIDRLNSPFEDLNYFVVLSKSGIDMAIRRDFEHKRNFNEHTFM